MLPKQEVSSSALKSLDRKSKLPRTSSTASVSSDAELRSRERSFYRRKQNLRPGSGPDHSVLMFCYLQDGSQVLDLMLQSSLLLFSVALNAKRFLQLRHQDRQPNGLRSPRGAARPGSDRRRGRSSRDSWDAGGFLQGQKKKKMCFKNS